MGMLKRYGRTIILITIVVLLGARLFSDDHARSFFSRDYWHNVFRYAQVMRLAHAVYVDPESRSFTAFTDAALQGGLRSLDRYSEYFNAGEFSAFELSNRRQYVGVGIQVQAISEGIFVTNVFAGGPAEVEGLLPGDAIVAVDSKATKGLDLEAVVGRIRGPAGTVVKLSIERVGETEPLEYNIHRASITLRSVDEVTMKTPSVGYFRINQFTVAVASELDEALEQLRAKGMERLIIDLRDNPGGVLESSIAVASRFLQPDSIVLSVEERDGRGRDYRSHNIMPRFDGPIAILVNSNTASAAEIVAGALRDHSRAKIFGETTFGKASVQGVFSFRRGDGLRVTTSRYRLPGGELINGTGIHPTHPVETKAGAAAAAFLQTTHMRFMDAENFEKHFGFPPQPDVVLQAALEEM
jgi:carboxyl-terminal processing protease